MRCMDCVGSSCMIGMVNVCEVELWWMVVVRMVMVGFFGLVGFMEEVVV